MSNVLTKLWVPLALALVAGGGAAFGVSVFERGRAQANLDASCSTSRDTLRTGLDAPKEALLTLLAFFDTVGAEGVTPESFERFTHGTIKRHPALAVLEYFAILPAAERATFTNVIRALYGSRLKTPFELKQPGANGLEIAPERPTHTVLTFMEPLDPGILGLDLEFDPVRTAMRVSAESTGVPTVSERFRMVEDEEGRYSVALLLRSGARWSREHSGYHRGLLIAIFRIAPLVQHLLGSSPSPFVLIDRGASDDRRILWESTPNLMSAAGLRSVQTIPFADRTYELICVDQAPRSPWAFFLGLASFAVIMLTSSLALSRRRERALSQRIDALGSYQIDGEIGSGATSTVLRARHQLLKRPTALKLLKNTDARAVARFEREVVLLSRLNHPNTVRVFDFGRTNEGQFFYAMELINGLTLEQMVALEGPMPEGRVARLMAQAAGAVAEAHAAGLLHRDLTPRNIMVCSRGGLPDVVKVLDFGLARAVDPDDDEVSAVSHLGREVAGTVGFIAPELIGGGAPSPRSDVFALGATAAFLLTGGAPFSGDSPSAVLASTLAGAHRVSTTDGSSALSMLVTRCLASRPELRPASAAELATAFHEAIASCPPFKRQDAAAFWTRHPNPLPLKPTQALVRREVETHSGSEE